MATRTTQRDPRSIITPDAFEVSSDLVGMPLALPSRRAVALAIDGIVIGLITVVTSSFALILGVVAAAFFLRAGFKRTEVRGSVFGRAMRLSVGCLGIVIGLVTAIVWTSVGFDVGGEGEAPAPGVVSGEPGEVLEQVAAAARLVRLQQAESLDEAVGIAEGFLETPLARQIGRSEPQELREALLEAVPAEAAWSTEWEAEVDRMLSAAAGPATLPELEPLPELEEEGGAGASEPAAIEAAMREELAALVADTLGALQARIDDLEGEVERGERALQRAEEELEESDVGFFAWLRGVADELGLGFGWAALYMTVFLSWWNGQTVGKKIMGIRVVRLDGERITWWVAFERAGGYAAGLATGLLGFAQVWWDANRQAIHDRIVGTVVVVDGAEKVSDWESAL